MKRKVIYAIVVLILAALAWVAYTKIPRDTKNADEEEMAIETPSRIVVKDNEVFIVVDKATQEKSGIITAPLKTSTHMEKIHAYGMVIDLQDLIAIRNRYTQAKSEYKKASTNLDASRKEYERLKILYEDNRNTSAKDMEAAQAAFRSDEADLRSARVELDAIESEARQRWGDVIVKWVMNTSGTFTKMLKAKDVLIQVTIPENIVLESIPQTALIQTQKNEVVPAEYAAISPHTDPRIQGKSYFYIAKNPDSALPAGMNVKVNLPAGPEAEGVVIPSLAVVWWQGKAYAYIEKEPEKFVRREIPTGNPLEEGWFVIKLFSPGDIAVIKGAQMLLSEEFRAQNKQIGD